MLVKLKFKKTVEVIEKLSKQEIAELSFDKVPDRVEGMADQIDDIKPLEYVSYEPVKKHIDIFKINRPKKRKRTIEMLDALILMELINLFAIMLLIIKVF